MAHWLRQSSQGMRNNSRSRTHACYGFKPGWVKLLLLLGCIVLLLLPKLDLIQKFNSYRSGHSEDDKSVSIFKVCLCYHHRYMHLCYSKMLEASISIQN